MPKMGLELAWVKGLTCNMMKKAEADLNEHPERKFKALQELRCRIEEETGFRPLMDDEFLLRFLRAKKFDVSRAFTTLQNYYAFKVRYSGVITDLLPNDLKFVFEADKIFMPPVRGPSGEGILIVFIGTVDVDAMTVEQHVAAALMSAEIGLETEGSQVCGCRIIVDMHGMTWRQFRHYVKLSFITLLVRCIQDVYPCRICGIHAVHEPASFRSAYQAMKPLLSKKIRERVHFHSSDLSSLHKILPPETLPEELGGSLDKRDFQNFRSLVLQNNDLLERINTYEYKGVRSPHQRDLNNTRDGNPEEKETTKTLFNVSFPQVD